MKDSILKALFYGKLYPQEICNPSGKEYRELEEEICRDYEELQKQLRDVLPEYEKRFIDFVEETQKLWEMEEAEMFVKGFCLGARMIIDIWGEEENSDKRNVTFLPPTEY